MNTKQMSADIEIEEGPDPVISLRIPPELIAKLDQVRGKASRSRIIRDALKTYLTRRLRA